MLTKTGAFAAAGAEGLTGKCLLPKQVQLDIREGHAATVDKVLAWMREDGGLRGVTVCDAGCGTGSLSIPLALEGATVSGSDISEAMVSALLGLLLHHSECWGD
jgi:predicted RNA methylase